MQPTGNSPWSHTHVFDEGNRAAEKGTRVVMLITAAMMFVEIAAGWWFNSMALLADGWHMSSHAVAIGLSALAYTAARRYANDRRFAFGTWKIEVLAGFASAIFLLGVALLMLSGSVERLLSPQPIQFAEAIVVATLGLAVNIGCALILHAAHDTGHGHHHGHHHGHSHAGDDTHGHDHPSHQSHDSERAPAHPEHGSPGGTDLNLRAAYLHVVADAATSVLAIVALLGGMVYGWGWLDPAMGIVGSFLVARWAFGLISDTGRVLLDREMDHPLVDKVRQALTGDTAWQAPPQIDDLHVWRVGRDKFAVIASLASDDPSLTPAAVRQVLARYAELAHVSVEVNRPGDLRKLQAPPAAA
ncbi:MAG TPA: CDF family Co(II)/Ni(II) efflux transporter DmeF [Candidatus Accumulibacter phosphatis]|nr:CDF family Co(II)/Ni(II) efflux transporter DmeF [Candidatus Accumulibacter phosphatis]HRQ95844.1 CDF family Co(II)/Ni(II) efflux transporter DmeF [Candidatus Accumulibacter phosphatis]